MIGKLICYFKGHKRGQRVNQEAPFDNSVYRFQCPRCKAIWTRKVRS